MLAEVLDRMDLLAGATRRSIAGMEALWHERDTQLRVAWAEAYQTAVQRARQPAHDRHTGRTVAWLEGFAAAAWLGRRPTASLSASAIKVDAHDDDEYRLSWTSTFMHDDVDLLIGRLTREQAQHLLSRLGSALDATELDAGYEIAARLTALGWRRTWRERERLYVWTLPEHGDPHGPLDALTGGYWTQYGTNPRNGLPGVPMSMPLSRVLRARPEVHDG